MYSIYSSTVENSGSVSGVSAADAVVDEDVANILVVADLVSDGDEEAVNADDRAATITESINKENVEVEYIMVVCYSWLQFLIMFVSLFRKQIRSNKL